VERPGGVVAIRCRCHSLSLSFVVSG
jgi:hypothetical protein